MDKSIKKFIPRFEDQSQNISTIDINDFISKDSIKALKHSGAFTGHSVVLGNESETAWLLKINDEVKPSNTHIHDELDSTEAAASEYGRKIGLSDMISFSIDGKVVWSDDSESGCVAVKFFPDDYLTAVDVHRLGEKMLKDTVTKFIQNNKMLKAAIFLYIIGDIDCNGNNVLCNMNDLKLIDFGLSFADDNWTPVPHDVPYFMRLLGEEAWKAIPVEYEYQKDFKFWITFLKEDDLIEVCHKYGVDYEGAIHRLHLIKDLVTSNNVMADSWNLWHNTLGVSTSENIVKSENLIKSPIPYHPENRFLEAPIETGNFNHKEFKLPNGLIYRTSKYHPDGGRTYHTLHHPDFKEPIAGAETDYSSGEDGHIHQIMSSKVSNPKLRGKGYGKSLYSAMLEHHLPEGHQLHSDQSISPEANLLWSSFKGMSGIGGYKAPYPKNPHNYMDDKNYAYTTHHIFLKDRSALDRSKMYKPIERKPSKNNQVKQDDSNLPLFNQKLAASENLVKAPHIDNNLSNLDGDSANADISHLKSYKMPNDMIVHQHKTDDGTMFSITDDDKKNGNRIAHLRVEHSDVPGVNNKVSIVHVDPEHRNSGYGKALYDTAIHHYKTLDSDSLLSPQSNKMWTDQLANDPKYSVALGTMGHWKPHVAQLKTKKSEELIKAPIDYDTGETAQSWQEYPRSSKREELHRVMIHPGKHHDRVAMIKGLGQETQKKKIDGVWNLKLYRGVSEGEHPDDYKVEPKSFTSNKDVAQQFASKYGGEAVEQWIPAAHISYSFNHAKLADGPEHTENAHEHEVIVGPKHGE